MKALYIATCNLIENSSGFRDNNPIVEVSGKCLYRNGEFSIYKHVEKAYYLLWKNVIICETTAPNKNLVDALAEKNEEKATSSFLYESCEQDIADAIFKYAPKYCFEIA